MKRPGYREAVEWIAYNDDQEIGDPEEGGYIMTVCIVADLWGKSMEQVAKDVIAKRKKEGLL